MNTTVDPEKIRLMFNNISGRYDVLNTILSFGIHWLWKKELVQLGMMGLDQNSKAKILDCATGTGDIAELWLKGLGPGAQVTATDFSDGMLEVARRRHEGSPIEFKLADVQRLPFEEHSFDRASISFGIRNVEDPKLALKDLARVVKPGGKVLILEFGQPSTAGFKQAYGFYSKSVLPWIGGVISGNVSAYRYLEKSSSVFPCGEKFLETARETQAYSKVEAKSLMGGLAWIYTLTVRTRH